MTARKSGTSETTEGKFFEQKKIGELNGIWAILLRIHLAVVTGISPLILAWCTWLTSEAFKNQSFRESGERFTEEEARQLEDRTREARTLLQDTFNAKFDIIATRLNDLDKDTTRILTILEKE